MDETTLQTLTLTSTTGIVVATMFIVEILKRLLKGMTWFEKIPVFVYAVVIAVILTIVAVQLNALQGELYQLLWSSIIGAASASGFYTWLRNPENVKTSSTLGDVQ